MLSNSVVSDYLCDPLDCCHPRSSVYGIFQAIILATAKSLQSCPTLCDPIDSSPAGSPIPGILQARTLEWVAISFSNAWKWKVKVKSLSRVQLLATTWTAGYQALLPMGFSRQEYWSGVPLEWGAIGVGCHFLLQGSFWPSEWTHCLPCLLQCRWILYHWAIGQALDSFVFRKLFGEEKVISRL